MSTIFSLSPRSGERAGVRGLALALVVTAALAQDAPIPAAGAAARDRLPRPAEMAPRATTTLLLGIARADGRLVVVGDRGIILTSGDGAKWEQVASPVHATLTAVSFVDAQHGWIVGHDATILHTADGGRTWALQNFRPEDNKPLLGVLGLDAQRAYAIGAYGLFLATADGGKTWSQVDAPELLADGLHANAMIRLGNGQLFVAGETGLLGLSPDGASWQRLKLPYEGSLFGALPRGEKGALVFGLRGNVYASDDVAAGKWTRVDTQTLQSMFGGALLPDGAAVLVGADGEVLRVDANGSAEKVRGAAGEHSSGTLAGVLPLDGGALLVVGENGVGTLKPN
jgi:photosystem II stability/assembly factor-like uncharacterized protein